VDRLANVRFLCDFSLRVNKRIRHLWFDRLGGLVVRVPGCRSRGPGFDSRCCRIFWEVVGLERGPLSLVSTIAELLERKSSGCCMETRDYGRRASVALTTLYRLFAKVGTNFCFKGRSLGRYSSLGDWGQEVSWILSHLWFIFDARLNKASLQAEAKQVWPLLCTASPIRVPDPNSLFLLIIRQLIEADCSRTDSSLVRRTWSALCHRTVRDSHLQLKRSLVLTLPSGGWPWICDCIEI
jgi:hypothetical protein